MQEAPEVVPVGSAGPAGGLLEVPAPAARAKGLFSPLLLRHLQYSAWHIHVYRVSGAALMQLQRGMFLARTVRVQGVGLPGVSAKARGCDAHGTMFCHV